MNGYVFKWKSELQFAVITFVVFVGGEFVRTEGNLPDNWGAWAVATAVAGARMVVAGLLPRLLAMRGDGA